MLDRPPIFKTWNQVYLAVLLFNAVVVALFYLITRLFT